jgi:glycine oxidase
MTGSVDVTVAGAGIIGSSIAWKLARKRLRVMLLDAGGMGVEASWASAGMLAPGGEFDRSGPWLDFRVGKLPAVPKPSIGVDRRKRLLNRFPKVRSH